MDLSGMTWCPPIYVTLTMLATMMYPVLALPMLLSRTIWKSCAPALVAAFPILGNLVIAYLMLADAFGGAAKGGARWITPVAAGIADSQRPLVYASLVSLAVVTMALVIAVRRSRSVQQGTEMSIPTGRRSAGLMMLLGLVLAIPSLGVSSWIVPSTSWRLEGVAAAQDVVALAAALVALLAVIIASWLVRSSNRTVGSDPVWLIHWRLLALCAFLSGCVGTTAWIVQSRFESIAKYGAG